MRMMKFGAGLLALLMMACGVESGTSKLETGSSGEKGTVRLPLVAPAPDGGIYRVVGATFHITGSETVSVSDTSADTVEATLLAGEYTVELEGDWHLERDDAPGVTVPAQLLSPNPLPFSVTKGATTQVRFQFKTPGDGSAEVGIQVDSGGWISGTLKFDYVDGPSSGLEELMGKQVPFLISFPSSMVTRPYPMDLEVAVEPGLTTVQFGGPYSAVLKRAAASLEGAPLYFRLTAEPDGRLRFGGMLIVSGSRGYDLEIAPSPSFPGTVDTSGGPAVAPFQFETFAILRNVSAPGSASGMAEVNLSP